MSRTYDAGLMNGYPCFVIAIAMIGACTAVIGDVAGHLGCFIFLKDSVNAIAFVALGTSVPGLYSISQTPYLSELPLKKLNFAACALNNHTETRKRARYPDHARYGKVKHTITLIHTIELAISNSFRYCFHTSGVLAKMAMRFETLCTYTLLWAKLGQIKKAI